MVTRLNSQWKLRSPTAPFTTEFNIPVMITPRVARTDTQMDNITRQLRLEIGAN